jgi:hypothetical protein
MQRPPAGNSCGRAAAERLEMLGHSSPAITRKHYIEPDQTVNTLTAEILESLAPREHDDEPR